MLRVRSGETRSTHRIDRVPEQPCGGLVQPGAEAIPDPDFDLGPTVVLGIVGDQVVDSDVGMSPPEIGHARQEPHGRERIVASQSDVSCPVTALDRSADFRTTKESTRQDPVEFLTFHSERHSFGMPVE